MSHVARRPALASLLVLVPLAPALALALALAAPAAAGEHAAPLEALIGVPVVVLIPMPATKNGVDVDGATGAIDRHRYADLLRNHGTAIEPGQIQVVTRVKVKGRHVEIQLGGGGYGTFWDQATGLTAGPWTDTEALAARGGSRFNVRFPRGVPASALTVDGLLAPLASLVALPERIPPVASEPTAAIDPYGGAIGRGAANDPSASDAYACAGYARREAVRPRSR